jgi:hypothetical protein
VQANSKSDMTIWGDFVWFLDLVKVKLENSRKSEKRENEFKETDILKDE